MGWGWRRREDEGYGERCGEDKAGEGGGRGRENLRIHVAHSGPRDVLQQPHLFPVLLGELLWMASQQRREKHIGKVRARVVASGQKRAGGGRARVLPRRSMVGG